MLELDEEHAGSTVLIDTLADRQGEQVDRGVTIAHISGSGIIKLLKSPDFCRA